MAITAAISSGLRSRSAHSQTVACLQPEVAIFAAGEKMLVFTSYTAMADMIAVRMAEVFGVFAETLDGRTLIDDRQAMIDRFAANKQGIYIYRENRMLVDASWLGMYQQEPHGSLLRVEFSFDHKLDEAFHLDIKKSQIGLNDEIYRYLNEQFLPAPRREANRRYRLGEQKKVTEGGSGAHRNSNTNIKNREAEAGGAEVKLINPATGEVEVKNPNGLFRLKLPIGSANTPGEVFVQPVPMISSGLLFEPVLIEQKRGVRINQAHPYYHKVYVPNLQSSVTIQGMDSLLWSLAVAELTAIRDATSEHFKDLRYEMSRILERLVTTLPDPDLSKTDD